MARNRRLRLNCILALAVLAMALAPQAAGVAGLPGKLEISAGAGLVVPASGMLSASLGDEATGAARLEVDRDDGARLSGVREGDATLTYRLLGLLPVKRVDVSVTTGRRLIPGGQSVGVAIDTAGVVVVGASDIGQVPSPARVAGIKAGDIIKTVDGRAVDSASALSGMLGSGGAVTVGIVRGGQPMDCEVTPVMDARDGCWRLGAWVRDSTAGIGTLTFMDPDTRSYGALGHAITDVDTSVTLPVGLGELYENRVVDVTPGESGAPGELTGDFVFDAKPIGTVLLNTARGIFGRLDRTTTCPLYPNGLPAGHRDDLHTGEASLLTTVGGDSVRQYRCEIVRLNERADAGTRAMIIRITDPELIGRTGGIVQGMSGSPIIQDGRLVGAVTHVMVNDPTMGYGITLDAMLEEADRLESGEDAGLAA